MNETQTTPKPTSSDRPQPPTHPRGRHAGPAPGLYSGADLLAALEANHRVTLDNILGEMLVAVLRQADPDRWSAHLVRGLLVLATEHPDRDAFLEALSAHVQAELLPDPAPRAPASSKHAAPVQG